MEIQLKKSQKLYNVVFKRIISFLGSALALLLFWWVLILIMIIQKCSSKGPIFFNQNRVGKNGKIFKLYKFRSMRTDVNPSLTSEEITNVYDLCTPFGKFLRKTSLDEWPQLINIIKGDMCFIGPRPLIDKYPDSLTIEKRKENGSIHLRPGMSGLAQVLGRTNVNPREKGIEDGIYYKKLSFFLDIRLFFKTFVTVVLNKNPNRNSNNIN